MTSAQKRSARQPRPEVTTVTTYTLLFWTAVGCAAGVLICLAVGKWTGWL